MRKPPMKPVEGDITQDISTVYYFPIDAEGTEREPMAIGLNADGSADLSRLPLEDQQRLNRFVRDEFSVPVSVENGKDFLRALITRTNQAYYRFRVSPERA